MLQEIVYAFLAAISVEVLLRLYYLSKNLNEGEMKRKNRLINKQKKT
jgi:hypothetical protein